MIGELLAVVGGKSVNRMAQAAQSLHRRVAALSLAYWLDGKCSACHGSGNTKDRPICTACRGTGRAEITGAGGFELEKVKDMISELEGLLHAHNVRAAARLFKKVQDS